LPELAQRGRAQILALVDPALRHLPFEAGQGDLRSIVLEPTADQDLARAVEQGDAHVRAVGFFKGHPASPRAGWLIPLTATAGVLHIDFRVLAGEAERKPFLPLAAIASLPGSPSHRARDIIGQPIADLGELLDRADAGLLIKLAFGRFPGVLARIDAALWHLP